MGRPTITLYPIGRPVRATITLYPIGRPIRATITLYPIGRPVRATITLYPIGRPVRATVTLYSIGRPVVNVLFSNCKGEMMVHCSTLRDHVITSLISCTTQLHTPLSPNNPFGSYDYLSNTSPNEQTKLMELLSQAENRKLVHTIDMERFAGLNFCGF